MTYTVKQLMKTLAELPQDANILLFLSVFDAKVANEATFGIPPGHQTVGLNCVFDYDNHNVYLVHSTQPDDK